MREQITYKQVLDSAGSLVALELWQGDHHITITFGYPNELFYTGYKWSEVKKVVDKLADKAQKEVNGSNVGKIYTEIELAESVDKLPKGA